MHIVKEGSPEYYSDFLFFYLSFLVDLNRMKIFTFVNKTKKICQS